MERCIAVGIVLAISLVGIALIWIAYPLGIAFLAGVRPTRSTQRESGRDPSISVILATRDETPVVRARVANILDSSYAADRIEVIVGVDAARGRASAAELCEMDPRVHVVRGDDPGGKAATLNAAVRVASHDILIFTDTAQTFDRDAIGALVDAMSDSELAAVSGLLDVDRPTGAPTLADRYWRYERWLRSAEARFRSAVGVTGAIYATRRALWEPLPAGLILDDVYLPMRLALAGWRIGFTEKARAFDQRRFTAAQERARKIRTLTGVIQLCVWLPAVLSPFRNPLWVQFVCHKLLRLLTPYLVVIGMFSAAWLFGAAVVRGGFGRELVPFVLLVIGAFAFRRVRTIVATQLAWGFALQSSAVVAAFNGMRGRWDVWQS